MHEAGPDDILGGVAGVNGMAKMSTMGFFWLSPSIVNWLKFEAKPTTFPSQLADTLGELS